MENCDDWGEHRDDDPGAEYPAAPTPPHERLWRHPSELAATTVREMPTSTALGRGFFILTGVAAVACAFGLIHLLSSGPGSAVVSDGANRVLSSAPGTAAPFAPSSASVRSTTTTAAAMTTALVVTTAPAPPATLLTSRGSSAIVWADGTWAVTSAEGMHVGDATEVTMPDGSTRGATVLAVDDDTDLAVLALAQPDDAVPAAPPVAELPAPGSTVVALARDGTSVSATLVAADGELLVETDDPVDLADGTPLTDENGSVVGLCGRSRDGRTRALDLSSVRELVQSLPGGWIGLSGKLGQDGVVVLEVVDGSPADAAGLLPGDVITAVDGVEIAELDRFSRDIRRREPGSAMAVTVQRGDETVELTLVVGDRQEQQSMAPVPSVDTTVDAVTTTVPTTSTSTAPAGSTAPPSSAAPTTTAPSRPTTTPASASG